MNLETMNLETLNKLKVIDLKELAKKNKLKCFHKLKKKKLIELLSKEHDKEHEREGICTLEKSIPDNIENEIIENDNIENDNSENDNSENEIIENEIIENEIIENEIIEKKNMKLTYIPKLIYQKKINEYWDKDLTIDYIKNNLHLTPKFGDIVQFDNSNAYGCYIVGNNKIIKCYGTVSDDICIPLEITQEFNDPYNTFKNIHTHFYGVEIKHNDDFIIDNFGIIDVPSKWLFYRINDEIYGKGIDIDIGEIDLININLDIIKEHPDRKYYSFINSIEYVKKKYSIMSKKYDNYGLYVTLKNGIDDKLTKNENDFIYNAIIPDYCYYSIDYQCDYYEIIFTYLSENKKDMNKFINKYYINTTHAFVSDIELIIEE